jgi:hypothetical protein
MNSSQQSGPQSIPDELDVIVRGNPWIIGRLRSWRTAAWTPVRRVAVVLPSRTGPLFHDLNYI